MVSSFEQKRQFFNNYDVILQKCREAVYRSGFQLEKLDPSSGHIEAISPSEWFFTARITIHVDRTGSVLVRSEAPSEVAIDLFLRNPYNVGVYFENLSALLKEASSASISTPSEIPLSFKILREFDVREHTEIVDTERIPLDNRHGSNDLTLEHEFSKTATNSISLETRQQSQGGIGLSFLEQLKVEAAEHLSKQIGYTNGETVTRRYIARLSVKQGDFVVYTIVWKRKVRSGKYEILVGNQHVILPFNAHFGLEYELTAEKHKSKEGFR